MEADFVLKDSNIGIFGLGLMGGSLAMRLKGQCARLIGFDAHLPTLELALSKKIVDQAESDLAIFFSQIDLLIIAVPVLSIMNLIQQLPAFIQHPCIVIDIGSAKRGIIEAMSALPENFDPIGGHPICGKEMLGLENADSNLYEDASFIITQLPRTTNRAKTAAHQIVSAIGANPLEMTAEEHDRVFAVTSHLPFLISSALVLATPKEASAFIGSGFKSTSRLAGTSSSMMLGVLQSNCENVLNALHGMQDQLAEIESALASQNFSKLESILNKAQASYQLFIT